MCRTNRSSSVPRCGIRIAWPFIQWGCDRMSLSTFASDRFSSCSVSCPYPSYGSSNMTEEEPPLPPPPLPDVWKSAAHYTILPSWQWVLQSIAHDRMSQVTVLPSAQQTKPAATVTPRTRSRRAHRQKRECTLQMELLGSDGAILLAAHGSSGALDGLEDKDELVRTLQRCQCVDKHISPPSVLLSWDVSLQECHNLLQDDLPKLQLTSEYCVLKEPTGSQGKGIYFVQTAEETHAIIHEHHVQLSNDPELLDHLYETKRRIPSWVLQAEIHPSLLTKNNRKFHIRTYVVIREEATKDVVQSYVFGRHEVRIAGQAVAEDAATTRIPQAHITNVDKSSQRCLLHEMDELADLQPAVERFVARCFGDYLLRDIIARVRHSMDDSRINKFALAGLDLMVTPSRQLYLLEVNANPVCPARESITEGFAQHLQDFFREFTSLVCGKSGPNFCTVQDILER